MYPGSPIAAYDRTATMFSPDGRLYQVEYASKIVNQGTLGTALVYDKGVLFGADKKLTSKLLLPDSIEKMFIVDHHIAAVSAGLVGDARRIIGLARQKSQENVMYYDSPIKVEVLVKEVANIMQIFTQYGGMRPFGVSLIFGGVDESGRRLFETEPSGAIAEYKATAIGKNKNKAIEVFEKNYSDNITFDDGINLLLRALQAGLEPKEKLDFKRIDFGYIDESKKEFVGIPNERLKSSLGKSK